MILECDYEVHTIISFDLEYTCNVKNLHSLSRNLTLMSSHGTHLNGKTNDDVTQLFAESEQNNLIYYFPSKLGELFKNLVSIEIRSCGLIEITNHDLKNLKNLKVIRLLKNKITIIYNHTFEFNKKLEKIDLIGNKIIHIEPSAFHGLKHLKIIDLRGNICISKKSKRGKARKFYSEVREKCFNTTASENLKIKEDRIEQQTENRAHQVKFHSFYLILFQYFLIFKKS